MKLENYSILTLFRCQLLFRHFHNDTDILTRKKIDILHSSKKADFIYVKNANRNTATRTAY